MTPPTLDGQKDDILINANDTLTITCRYDVTYFFFAVELYLSKVHVKVHFYLTHSNSLLFKHSMENATDTEPVK